jgi:hypothetical protein
MFLEIPAGMLDDAKEVKGKAVQEIQGETHLTIHKEELIDFTTLALEKLIKLRNYSLEHMRVPRPSMNSLHCSYGRQSLNEARSRISSVDTLVCEPRVR